MEAPYEIWLSLAKEKMFKECRRRRTDNRAWRYVKLYPTKKKRIQYSLQNYNQLRNVDKIFILERDLF